MTRLLLSLALALFAVLPAAAQPNLLGGEFLRPSPRRVDPGDVFSFSYSLVNSGMAGAPAFSIAAYLSTDDHLSNDDVLLRRVSADGLAAQTSRVEMLTVTTPTVARGGYFVLLVMDDPDRVAETDETDNTSSGSITIGGNADGPDLAFNRADLEDVTAAPGDRVSVRYTVANRGRSDVEDFEVGYYLRPINAPRSEYIFLERETLGNLDAGDDDDESEQVTIPTSVPPGRYALLVLADDRNLIEEGDETNNQIGAGLITITGATAAEDMGASASVRVAAWPNPVSGVVALRFDTPEMGPVRLAVFDAVGREVAVMLDAPFAVGSHAVTFDTSRLPPGVYVARIVTVRGVAAATLTVVR